jgi:hypothetical protein
MEYRRDPIRAVAPTLPYLVETTDQRFSCLKYGLDQMASAPMMDTTLYTK